MTTMHISTIDGLIQALQQIKTKQHGVGSIPVVMLSFGTETPVPVCAQEIRISKTGTKRQVKTGGLPAVLIGRSR